MTADERFLEELAAALHVRGRARSRLLMECRDHLLDSSASCGPEEAVRRFGSPTEVAAAWHLEVGTRRTLRAALPADALGPNMARLRREHHRHLGNGYCTRPPELDCAFESIVETCTSSRPASSSDPPCKPHDDATTKGQDRRATMFDRILNGITEGEAS